MIVCDCQNECKLPKTVVNPSVIHFPQIFRAPIDHKSVQLHLKRQAVTDVQLFQINIAMIVSVSQL